ncbi:DUF2975 domain-containing protein [Streptomyces mayteni]
MNDASWWTRAENHVLEGTIGIGLLLVGLFQVLFPVLAVVGLLPLTDETRGVPVEALADGPGLAASASASASVTLRAADQAQLALTDPGLVDRALFVLPGLTSAILLVVILEVLLRIVRTFRHGDFFQPPNVRRLAVIACALVLIGLVSPLVDVVTTELLVGGTPAEDAVRTLYELDVPMVFLALLVAAAAVAFRHGARLRADTEGLV